MIGALRHKVELQTPQRVFDDGGGSTVTWTAGSSFWARIERLTSSRDFSGDRSNRLRRIAAVVRYRNDISLGDRLLFDDAAYEIVSIEDDGEGKRRTLICEEAIS